MVGSRPRPIPNILSAPNQTREDLPGLCDGRTNEVGGWEKYKNGMPKTPKS